MPPPPLALLATGSRLGMSMGIFQSGMINGNGFGVGAGTGTGTGTGIGTGCLRRRVTLFFQPHRIPL